VGDDVSNFWPGPGRALQAHLDLFRYVDRAHDWITANAGGVTETQLAAAPATLRQRLRLMTSMAQIVTDDGTTVSNQPDEPAAVLSQGNVNRGVGQVNTEWEILNQGETHYVSHHIMSMCAAAAEQAGDEPLFPTDLPCPQGLIVFEYPLLIPDLHPETGEIVPMLTMPIRAIAWGQNPTVFTPKNDGSGLSVPMPGIFYGLYTDENAWRTLFLPSVEKALPDEWENFKEVYADPDATLHDRDPIWCIDTSAWSYSVPWQRSASLAPVSAMEQGEIHQTVAHIRRFMLALWRFCWQRILIPQTYKPTRHEQKRALRAGVTLEDGYVKILRLRRHVEAEARGEHVDESDPLSYDHSWIVRGHPRRQHYATLGPARNPDGSFNVDSHRLIWIDPYQKGNPFVAPTVGHNVTAIVR
jgi:hypothetical protein